MQRALIPYATLKRQEIQLRTCMKSKSIPTHGAANTSYDGVKGEEVFFAAWDENDNFSDTKVVHGLPINEKFRAILRVFGTAKGNHSFGNVTFDCPVSFEVDTKRWFCNSMMMIKSSGVCNGTKECDDGSDEDEYMCKGSNNRLLVISRCVNIAILVLGYMLSVLHLPFVTLKRSCATPNEGNEKNDVETSAAGDTEFFKLVYRVCKEFEEWNNVGTVEGPTKEDFKDIIKNYKILHKENRLEKLRMAKHAIKNLSLSDSFYYTCMEIADALNRLEHEELHQHHQNANECIRSILTEHRPHANCDNCGKICSTCDRQQTNWVVPNFFIQSRERHECMGRFKRFIRVNLGPTSYRRIAIAISVTSTALLFLIDTVAPYYDSHMDLSFSSAINHIEHYFIRSDSKSKEVSDIDLTNTKYYYYIVSILSSLILTIFYGFNLSVITRHRESMIASISTFGCVKLADLCSCLSVFFPYHCLALEFANIQYRKLNKEFKMRSALKKIDLKENNVKQTQKILIAIRLQKDLSKTVAFESDLNRIIVGSFMINILVEGMPQLMVMGSLLVSELTVGFGPLRTIFENVLTTYLGTPPTTSFVLMATLQIIKIGVGVIGIFSSFAFGLDIGFVGGTMKLLAVLCLMTSKLFLVTLQFCQTPYVYGLVTIAEFMIALSFCKITQKKVNLMEDILPIVVSPALHVTGHKVARHSKSESLKFQCLLKWDGTPSIVILYFAYLILAYLPIQYVLQIPQIEELLQIPEKQDVMQGYTNYAMIGYVMSIIPFLALRGIFYQFGTRWRKILAHKKKLGSL